MNIRFKYIFTLIAALVLTACFDEPGNEITFSADPQLEWDKSDSGSQGVYFREDDGEPLEDEFVVNLVGPHRSEAVTFTISVGDLTTAIEGVHYDLPNGLSYSIPANSSSVKVPVIIYDDAIELDEVLVLDLDISNASIKISPNYFNLIHTISVICPSNLGGTYSFVTTNTVAGPAGAGNVGNCQNITGNGSLTAIGGGAYALTDATFGIFGCVYGDPAQTGVVLNDECKRLFFTGTDIYGDSYSISVVSVTETVLTIDVINTYGDGGRVALTRTDAKTWPLDLTD